MKIVLLKSNAFKSGGCEKYCIHLTKAFVQNNCNVSLLTNNNIHNSQIDGCLVENINQLYPLSYLKMFQFNQQCIKWCQRNKPDIIFGLERTTQQTHYRAGNGVHAEYLRQRYNTEKWLRKASFYINPLHRLILSYEKKAFENPALQVLFTNSNKVKNEVLAHYNVPFEKIEVVHNGVEWDEMESDFNQWDLQRGFIAKELGLDLGKFQFLFIGHGYRRKGLIYLLEALSKLKSNSYQLSVVGKDKEINFFKEYTKKLKIQNNIKFFGSQSNVRNFYQIADTLIIPSIYDPFANVTVEALAMGVFVISSSFNGGSEIITPANGAIISDIYNKEAFIESLDLAMNRPKTIHSSQAIRNSVAHLKFQNQLNQIVNLTLKYT